MLPLNPGGKVALALSTISASMVATASHLMSATMHSLHVSRDHPLGMQLYMNTSRV